MPFTLTPEYLHTILDPMSKGDLGAFLRVLDPEVQWTIVDPVYNPVTLTGTYNLQTFQEKLGKPLFSRLTGPSSTIIDELDIIGLKAIVEASGFATQKNGKPCNNKFCWILIFDSESGKVVKIREYTNTALLKEVMEENEGE